MRAIRIFLIVLSSLLLVSFALVSALNTSLQQESTVTNLLDEAQVYPIIRDQVRAEAINNVSLDSPYGPVLTTQLDSVLQTELVKTLFQPVISGLVNWLREPLSSEPSFAVSLVELRTALSNQQPAGVSPNKLSDYQFFLKKTIPDSIEINPHSGNIDLLTNLTTFKSVVQKLPQMQIMLLVIIIIAALLTALASLLSKRSIVGALAAAALAAAVILFVMTLSAPQLIAILKNQNNTWLISIRIVLASAGLLKPLMSFYVGAGVVLGIVATALWLVRRRKRKAKLKE